MHRDMLRPILFRLILMFIIAGASSYCRAGETYQPLFVVERSSNANVVHYDAKIDEDGRIDSREPVIAYWIMAAKDGRRQELNFLEKSKAYGVIVKPSLTGASYRIVLVSQKNREIEISRDGEA